MGSHELVQSVSDATFEATVKSGLWLVDFFADWCGPCRMLAPVIHQVAGEMGGRLGFLKVDVDDAQETAAKFGVTSIPTVVLVKDGKEVGRFVGLKDAQKVKDFLAPHVSN